MKITYPDLPINRRRDDIITAMRNHQVVIIVGQTGSGKTTQLPKMAMELAAKRFGRVGCTQPRRLAAASVSCRVAEELGCEIGEEVGYQVRFEDKTSSDTRLKFMTDGILLSETQQDPDLRQYHTLIIDEAHERSLNIDFLLGYLKLLIARRKDLKLIISSATLDAGSFSEFFDHAPVIEVEGNVFPVELHYMPPQHEDEELSHHVVRAVEWLNGLDDRGDVLVFLPGEREIKETAEKLEGRQFRNTQILPLYARLGLAAQQKIFRPDGRNRRIILATNVAETSLTIPGIIYVIDSGLARVSRYSPARQVQKLQVEPISQAAAQQRSGRCGRLCDGVCIRLYSEEDWNSRSLFTDPEIRRSALAGALLRMKDLGLPEMHEYPLIDPPSSKLVMEGYRTLREIGALDREKKLTDLGKKLARLPIDPRVGRMLLEAQHEQALAEVLVIVSGLEIMDPRERPSEAAQQADQAHAVWKNEDSDFLSMLNLWQDARQFQEGKQLLRNRLRKWCSKNFLNFNRMVEWFNLWEDLARVCKENLRCRIPHLEKDPERRASYTMIHRSILAGVPRQIGFWDSEQKEYRGAGGRHFAIFPGSGMFRRKKRCEWVMGTELVDTSRLWMRRVAKLDPSWVEQVVPQLCESHYSSASWNKDHGAVYALERVVSGGLTLVHDRRVHYGRINPKHAREILIRDGILHDGFRTSIPCIKRLGEIREGIRQIEGKLRRPDQVWCEEAAFEYFNKRIPQSCCTAKQFIKWSSKIESENSEVLAMKPEEFMYQQWGSELLNGFPDVLKGKNDEYTVYYQYDPGAADDGVTLGVHIDQWSDFPEWLPTWGVPGHLEQRTEILLRTLPKDLRSFLQPISRKAADFADLCRKQTPSSSLYNVLAEYVSTETGRYCDPTMFDPSRLPLELITKIWVCDDDGEELAFGSDVAQLNKKLQRQISSRFRETANDLMFRTGMKIWDCGELPTVINVGGTSGYPALTDEQTSIGVRVFEHQEQAASSHRAACVRLIKLRNTDQLNHLKKRLPLSFEGQFALGHLGKHPQTNTEDFLDVCAELAMGIPLPRTPQQYAETELRFRQNLFDAAQQVAIVWNDLLATYQEVEKFLVQMGSNRHFQKIADDLTHQTEWLLRPRFLWNHGAERLGDIKRYLRGMRERMERIRQQSLDKELERIDTFRRVCREWERLFPNVQENNSDGIRFGYLLEEYRLAVFAPKTPVKNKVSEKKLLNMLEEWEKK